MTTKRTRSKMKRVKRVKRTMKRSLKRRSFKNTKRTKRKHINENREDMIKYLKENNIMDDTRRILSTVSRYYKFREYLPHISNKAHSKLDRGNQYLNPLVPFQKIGNKMLGIIDDNNNESKSVIDISEGREDKVAVIFNKGGISWRNDNLHSGEMRWIVDYVQNKKQNKGIFTI